MKIFTFDLHKSEAALFVALIAIVGIFCLILFCRGLRALKAAAFGGSLGYQDAAIPDYFTALREQDLEEMVEEEKVLI